MASRPPDLPDRERDPAKGRFLIINLHRLVGTALVVLGLLVIEGRIDWPHTLGYTMVVLGVFDVFLAPILLARLWRTPRP